MKEENVFGLPMNVGSRDEVLADLATAGDRPTMLAVMRCADQPSFEVHPTVRARNKITQCDQCREMCWYDPKYAIPGLKVRCMHCLPADTKPYAQTEQVAELRRLALDLPPGS